MKDKTTLLAHIRKQVKAYGSQKAYAEHLGISQPYLSDVLHGRRDLSREVASLLGYKKLTIFVDDRKVTKP